MEMLAFWGIIPILINLGIFIFAVFAVIKILKLMKQRNEYLKDIRDELKKSNSIL